MQIHDVVALTEDVPEHDLRRGQVGTIIEQWEPDVFEIEFADTDGVTYAQVALHTRQLMILRWQPDARRSA